MVPCGLLAKTKKVNWAQVITLVDGNVLRVFAGYHTTWYIDTQVQQLWASGANENGELGIGDKENRNRFELIEL